MLENVNIDEGNIFSLFNKNPRILLKYISSYATDEIVEDVIHYATLRKAPRNQNSESRISRMNSLNVAPSSGVIESPIRKISSLFEPLAFRPILSTGHNGCQSFLEPHFTFNGLQAKNSLENLASVAQSNENLDSSASKIPDRAESAEEKNLLADSFAELNSSDLMQELVLDIWNDSDLPTLCFKILRNVCLLLHADRASLFMVDTNPSTRERILASMLFDVTAESNLAESLKNSAANNFSLPFGVGIVGWVAQTGEFLNISKVYEDPRFNRDVDLKTGFQTRCLICMPIKDGAGNVLAVAQAMNKIPETTELDCAQKTHRQTYPVFSTRDVSVFRAYTSFCGIGLHQAQILWKSQLETRRSRVLLELARLMFSEQSDVSRLIYTILMHSQSLLTCQRCQILLVNNFKDDTSDSQVFEEAYDYTWNDGQVDFNEVLKRNHAVEHARFPMQTGLACHVARSGETINLPNVVLDPRFDPAMDCEDPVWKTRSILCMPIKHSNGRVLGVCQLINKASSPPQASLARSCSVETVAEHWSGAFSRSDESLFEAFALFAGLGIANTQMYEKVLRAEAKQRIAFDVLSYHATATTAEATALSKELIPSAKYYRLNTFGFTDFYLSVDDTLKACIRMFSDMGFINRFCIDYNSLCRWLLSIKKNYRAVTYHNWRHAFNVAQTMFVMFKNGEMERVFDDLECLAIIIACLSHDLDHRGTNNQFQVRTMSPLVNLYSTSVLEHHHFDQCIMLLNTKGNDILCHLGHDEYRRAVSLMEKAILATDLSRYFAKLPQFRQVLDENAGSMEADMAADSHIAVLSIWQSETSQRELLMSMLMTASDVSASTKPWPVQKKTAELVAKEFFEQGDLEKQKLNIKPAAVMDRDLCHQLPQMQIEFFDGICAPVYELITRVCGRLRPLLDGCLANRDCWDSLARGEPVRESSMRLPNDDDGGTPYRDRLVALLNSPNTTSTTASRLTVLPAADPTVCGSTELAAPLPNAPPPMSVEKSADGDQTATVTTVGGGVS